MAATVIVNFMTVVHKSSNGISTMFPDVCKTPMAPSPVPIPYPNVAMSQHAADTASSVKADGNPIMVSTSKFATSTGDEPGSLLGVVSNKIKGSANPVAYSFDVKAEGKNVFRLLDMMLQNGNSNPVNGGTGADLQPGAAASAEGQDPEEFKIVEVKWTKTKCKCGDPVKIQTKTENFDDGDPVPHTITRGRKRNIDNTTGRTSGNSVTIDWLTLNGPWQKDKTKLKAKATGKGGPKETAEELEIEVPAEKEDTYGERITLPAHDLQQVNVGGIVKSVAKPTGSRYYCYRRYTISIKKGIFKVLSKLKVDVVSTGTTKITNKQLKKYKKAWSNQIRSVWDNTWKEHRVGCKRGNKCKCPGGCCLFPIRVECKFVSGGAHHTVKLRAGTRGPGMPAFSVDDWYTATSGVKSPVVYAHEFGHVIGMTDEYSGAAGIKSFVFSDKVGTKHYKSSVMAVGSLAFERHWTSHPDGGRSIHKWFLDSAADSYKVSKIASS